jgi:hypothetical protein
MDALEDPNVEIEKKEELFEELEVVSNYLIYIYDIKC